MSQHGSEKPARRTTTMPRSTPEQELMAAEKRLEEARKRRAQGRQKRRALELEGNGLADSISAELYLAGREGRDPDIGNHRTRVAEIKAALADLGRVEDGLEAAVVEAGNAVAAVRFKHAPAFEATLADQAAKLAAERVQLEQALAAVTAREETVRAGWRTIAASIPGQSTDVPFEDGATVPQRRPSDPHVGISAHVVQPDWPEWFRDVVTRSQNEYARDPEQVTA